MTSSSAGPPLAAWYLGVAVTGVDAAAVAYVMPALRRDLGTDAAAASWLLTLMVLGALVGAPLGGAAARALGATRAFRLGCALFALGALVSATGGGLAVVLVGRFLQGLGGGPVLPLAASMVTRAWPVERHGRLLASLSLVYGLSFLVGVVGTPVVLSAGWRWVYAGEALLSAAAGVAMGRSPRPEGVLEPRPSWDLPGLLAWALSLSCLSFAINRIQGGTVSGGWLWMLTGLGIGLAGAFVAIEQRPGAAVFPPSIFLHGDMRIVFLLCLGTGVGQVVLVQVPSVAGARLGMSPAASGWLMLPLVLGGLSATALNTLWLDRLGPRTVLVAGALAAVSGTLIESALPPARPLFLAAAALLGLGVAALSGGPLRYVAARAVAASEQATAQAAVATLTNVGVLFGSALVGAVAGSSSDERIAWERAMLVAATLMAVTLLPTLALGQRVIRRTPETAALTETD